MSLLILPTADADDPLLATLHLLRTAEDLLRAFELHVQGRFATSPGRLALLLLLARSGERGARPAELAEQARISRPTATGLLRGLEAEGLVTRRPDPRDRRAVRVALTPSGRARARAIAPLHARRLAALTRSLSGPERAQLAALLDRVRAGLDALSGA